MSHKCFQIFWRTVQGGLYPPPSCSVFIESSICYQCRCCFFFLLWKWKKSVMTTKHFNEGSFNMPQELENLLNSWLDSLGRFTMCIITHVCMYEHTMCSLEAAPCSSSERLSSPNLTLPQRQTKPPLWHCDRKKKSLRVLETHNKSIHYLRVNSFRKEAYVIYSSMLRGCWEREEGKKRRRSRECSGTRQAASWERILFLFLTPQREVGTSKQTNRVKKCFLL